MVDNIAKLCEQVDFQPMLGSLYTYVLHLHSFNFVEPQSPAESAAIWGSCRQRLDTELQPVASKVSSKES
jgi:hypothetical protein